MNIEKADLEINEFFNGTRLFSRIDVQVIETRSNDIDLILGDRRLRMCEAPKIKGFVLDSNFEKTLLFNPIAITPRQRK